MTPQDREFNLEVYRILAQSGTDKKTLRLAREKLGLDRTSYARKMICKLCGHYQIYKTYLVDVGKNGKVSDPSIPVDFSYEEAQIRDRDESSKCKNCLGWAMTEQDPEKLREALCKILRSRNSMINL